MGMPSGVTVGKYLGVLAAILGVGVGFGVMFGSGLQYASGSSNGTQETGTISGIEYLLQADSGFFILPILLIGMSLIGGYGAVKEKRFVVLAVSIPFWLLALLSFTLGPAVAPSALLFLASGILLTPAYWDEES